MAGRTNAAKPSKIQDLNLDDIVTSEKHDQDFADLNERLSELERRFGSNEKIAITLADASENAVKMQKLFSDSIIRSLQKDDEVKEAIGTLICTADRNFLSLWLRRLGWAAWSVIVFIAGVTVTIIVTNYVGNTGADEPTSIDRQLQ